MAKQAFMYMSPDPVCVLGDISVTNVLQTFNQSQKSHLLVVNSDDQLIGVISKKDLLEELESLLEHSSGKTYNEMVLSSRKAADIMTADPIVVKKNDTIDLAAEYLLQQYFHCVPVVDKGKAVGVITAFDLLKGYYQEFG